MKDVKVSIIPDFEIVEVAGEFMGIPLGKAASFFNGVVALNDAAAFVLKHMSTPITKEELLNLLINEYSVDRLTANNDLDTLLTKIQEYGLITVYESE